MRIFGFDGINIIQSVSNRDWPKISQQMDWPMGRINAGDWPGRSRLRHTVSLLEINMSLTFIFDVRPGGSLSSHNRGWLPVQMGFIKSQPGLICAQIYTAEYFINTCHVYISSFLHWTFNKIHWSIYSITALKTQFKARVVVFHG